MTDPHRVEWRWLLMGPGLGLVCGFVTVTLLYAVPLLLAAPLAAVVIAPIVGGLAGGPVGAGVGLVAGLPFVFLVGPDLPLRVAARRACVLGATMPPVVLLLASAWLPWSGVFAAPSFTWVGGFPYVAAAFLGGLTAEAAVRLDMPRSPVS